MSAMVPRRKTFEEAFELTNVSKSSEKLEDKSRQTYISKQPAWSPGAALPYKTPPIKRGKTSIAPGRAFGGHVYVQAPLAAAKLLDAEEGQHTSGKQNDRSIVSIQGVFTNAGLIDRPFIYDVTKIASGRSTATCNIVVRQPTETSSHPDGPYPSSDASLQLGDACFTCITTFKRALYLDRQYQSSLSPQQRYASILSTRKPGEWPESPNCDIDSLKAMFPDAGHLDFPVLDMYKVDMTGFNADKPIDERRELIYYRPMKPLPADHVNAHIVCHAYGADRNGLIMQGNHIGFGFNLGVVGSLSYAFYVHVNGDETIMKGDGWWLQEVEWPRFSAGRGLMENRIWSPEGIHVATAYQDGIVLPKANPVRTEKL